MVPKVKFGLYKNSLSSCCDTVYMSHHSSMFSHMGCSLPALGLSVGLKGVFHKQASVRVLPWTPVPRWAQGTPNSVKVSCWDKSQKFPEALGPPRSHFFHLWFQYLTIIYRWLGLNKPFSILFMHREISLHLFECWLGSWSHFVQVYLFALKQIEKHTDNEM